jgi:hypothetical protein
MSNGAIGAAGGGAAAAYMAMVKKVRASGAVARILPNDFETLVNKSKEPLVIFQPPSFWSKSNKYLTNYKGFFFFTKSKTALNFSSTVEFFEAEKIWIPE